jgi:hypothetical protein
MENRRSKGCNHSLRKKTELPINIVLLLLVGIVVLTSLVACVLFLQRRFNPKLQFSLRSFLVLVATVAIILACTIGYRQSYMAQVTWIPLAKENTANVFPAAKVQKTDDGRFEFVYYARNRSIQRLIANNNIGNLVVTEEAVRVISRDESEAHDQLQRIQKSDTLPKGAFTIRGKLHDTNGKPVPGALIDILGSFQFVNCFRTRDDGTFTLALSDRDASVPVGVGYYFRIRSANETADNPIRWHSAYFSLDSNNPQMLVDIQLPK